MTTSLLRVLSFLCALTFVMPASALARSPLGPPDAATVEAAANAKTWAVRGIWIPAAAGAAFAMAVQPGGKMHVPTWQVATLASLFGFSATWGVSLGYYRAGHPMYATLSGLGRSALIAGSIALERQRSSCAECDGLPAVALLGIAGAVAWDVIDLGRLTGVVRSDAARAKLISMLPVVAPAERGATIGLAGAF